MLISVVLHIILPSSVAFVKLFVRFLGVPSQAHFCSAPANISRGTKEIAFSAVHSYWLLLTSGIASVTLQDDSLYEISPGCRWRHNKLLSRKTNWMPLKWNEKNTKKFPFWCHCKSIKTVLTDFHHQELLVYFCSTYCTQFFFFSPVWIPFYMYMHEGTCFVVCT